MAMLGVSRAILGVLKAILGLWKAILGGLGGHLGISGGHLVGERAAKSQNLPILGLLSGTLGPKWAQDAPSWAHMVRLESSQTSLGGSRNAF